MDWALGYAENDGVEDAIVMLREHRNVGTSKSFASRTRKSVKANSEQSLGLIGLSPTQYPYRTGEKRRSGMQQPVAEFKRLWTTKITSHECKRNENFFEERNSSRESLTRSPNPKRYSRRDLDENIEGGLMKIR